MSSEDEFSIQKFFEIMSQGRVAAAKCRKCGHIMVPPKPVCVKCFSRDLTWTDLSPQGEIIAFSEIHVSNHEFQKMVPYVVAVVRHREGVNLAGIIKGVSRNDVRIGTKVRIEIDPRPSERWPYWPRYQYLKQPE